MRSTLRRSMIELSIDGRVEKCESQPRDGDRHQDPKQLRTLMNLMQCIDSAATIVSDTSTALVSAMDVAARNLKITFPLNEVKL
jgi:hypothetical protein